MAGLKGLADALRAEKEEQSTLDAIFEEQPVTLTEFVTNSKFLNNPKLSEKQYDFVRHFEQIFYTETYDLMVAEWGDVWKPVRFVNELAAEWGKGAGKDHVCQISVCRVAYLLLCLRNPQAYFELAPQTIIHTLNVAASAPQAQGVFFKPLRTLIVGAPWFRDKFEGDEPGPQATAIRFKKQIELVSGHSSAETLEGKNLIAAIADEISAFPTLEEVRTNKLGRSPAKTSDGILEMLKSSATTRFPENFKLAQISYPRFKGDAIEQAVFEGNKDLEKRGAESSHYVSGPLATWEVNPRYDKFERIAVPGATVLVPKVKRIIEDYEKDPIYARAKYECKPELSANQFFRNEIAVNETFSEMRPEPVVLEYIWGVEESTAGEWMRDERGNPVPPQPGWQVAFRMAPDFQPIRGAIYAIHGDMAISGDRAGVAMCHVRNFASGEWEFQAHEHDSMRSTYEARPVVKVDFVTSFEADVAAQPKAREVQIRWYRKLIYDLLARGFNIQRVTFDNFQSADTIQILEARGLEADVQSMDRTSEPWNNLRDVMYDGRLEGYYRQRLIDEIMGLTLLPNGKLDHPPGGSKDEADALCGAVLGAVEIGGSEGESAIRVGYEDDDLDLSVPHNEEWTDNASLDAEIHEWGDFEQLGRLEI